MGKVLITGASGFLGSHLCNTLEGDLIKVYNTKKIEDGWFCDLSRKEMVKMLLKKSNPDIIVHCAAFPSPKHPENYEEFINNHILSTVHLLENCKPKTKFIYISSVLVFGDCFPTIEPTNLYGCLKLNCENLCNTYAKLRNLNVKIIRPCAIVGSGLTHGLLFDLKRKLESDSEELELFGASPGTCKPFVHVEDVCQWVKNSIQQDIPIPINCFPVDSITVKEVAEIAMQCLNKQKPIKWLGEESIWKGDNKHIDTSRQTNIFIQRSSVDAIRKIYS